ncbi:MULTISPECIES: phBC6A51 family helix-turn-helix protein [unclassified Dysgonomonas]|jgi:hypothetical protein|uniref:phBC6A51 family helix-turn-helix protein n=1 Tax=unclassified Dysgonomonas TaxID=2630389 RepID=UPI0025C58C37|nr:MULTISPECIES: phBC6A51 family helix-turn-helix protein [unclassified Dysgonomonas]MDR2002660.1 hypothetical protein [Prevotella sp.]HMM04727.1 phBC6A51 family helix-turn-helix protein [Dysgonomonas sp.]
MAKYNKKIVENICELIRTDSYTIAEICRTVGIAKDTYYHWLKTKSDFSDAIKKAENEFNELIITEAKKSLVKMIRGYTVQEKRTVTADTGKRDENDKPIVKVKEHSVTDKHYQPVPAAVFFALSNRDPKNWQNNRTSNDQFNGSNDTSDDDKPATMRLPDGTEIEV